MRSPVGGDIDGYKANNGAIVRYDRKANDFVKGHGSGIATMFKPSGKDGYFHRRIAKDGGAKND